MRTFILAILIVLSSCTPRRFYVDKVKVDETKKLLDQLVADNEIPGINFSLIDKHGKEFNFSSGYENTTTQNKLDKSHLLFSGSIGKTYAVALVMKLVDKKKINLEDRILDHLPKEEWLNNLPNIQEITIEMLLSHTSGLPRWVMKGDVWESVANDPDKIWSYKGRLSYVFDEKPVHEAGKGWAYSDTNYLLLGYLIETLEKGYYYDILKEKVLKPFKLEETVAADKRDISKLAMGYSKLPEFFKMPKEIVSDGKVVFNPQMEWTGGGIVSSTPDLAKWCKIYYTSDVFSDDLKKKVIEVNPNGDKVYAEIHSYGMGSFIYDTEQGVAYGHSGFMPGYNSIMAYYPKLDIAVALQINCDYGTQKMPLVTYLNKLMVNFL